MTARSHKKGARKRRPAPPGPLPSTGAAIAAPPSGAGRGANGAVDTARESVPAAVAPPEAPTASLTAPAKLSKRERRAAARTVAAAPPRVRWLGPLALAWPRPARLAPRVWAWPALAGWAADLAALGAIALVATALVGDGLVNGRVAFERDTYLFYYPLYQWFAEQWRAGHLPLWIPQLFSGYPLYADSETGMLYPLHWLFFGLLPTPTAFVALRLLHFVMAGAFMYAWMRVLALGRLAALLAALTFAYASFLVGQVHHENLFRTAIWLPAVLCWTELAYRCTGRARALALLAGGATLGLQLTALHVQPALMTLMALALYVAFRTVCPPRGACLDLSVLFRRQWTAARQQVRWLAGRVALGGAALAVIMSLGIGLAFAQLLPLYELGMQTFRGAGVPFAFATSYSIHPSQLVTLLFPYFFRHTVASWQLWTGWETLIYVGVAPLVLALVALVAVRRREIVFFGGLALFGALLAFGDYSPLPVLELLWPLPGFSALRVPGRYTLLLVVALAALAGYGLDWLERTARAPGRRAPLLAVVVGMAGAVTALLALFVVGQQWLLAAPADAKSLISGTYLAARRMYRELNAEMVYTGLLSSLDLANHRTALSFTLLLLVVGLLALCYVARRRVALWRGGLVALTALDLVLWGRGFHPRETLAELTQPPPAVEYLQAQGEPLSRLWVSSDQLRTLEYNRPVTWGVEQAGGYSSLEPQRHAEYAAVVANTPGMLLDLWGVRWVAVPTRSTGSPSSHAAAFYPGRPMFDAGAGNLAAEERFAVRDRQATDLRLVATLSYADGLPDGARVGEIVVTTVDGRSRVLPLLVGRDVSESAYDREDVRPRVRHRQAEVAFTETVRDVAGSPYPSHYYYSQHSLPDHPTVRQITVRYTNGIGVMRVYGMALGDEAAGHVYQIGQWDRAKYRLVHTDRETQLYENAGAFPRAFVVGAGVLPRDELGGVYSMYLDPFDPRSEVLLDEPPPASLANAPPVRTMGEGTVAPASGVRAAAIESYAPERVVVRATAERPGFLVLTDLYHPGWRARVDGEQAEVVRGDYIFRAVPIGAGSHEVEFVFEPTTVWVGRLVSLLTLLALLGTALALWRWPRRVPQARSLG